jgi:hypothetical protein|tara:strand:+ start:1457 stop:1966 length:510 start_codon:yes stop_codon:yes gene_type:complete
MNLDKAKQQEYDIIVSEYESFMKSHGAQIEAGDMKLLQKMMRLESKKAVFEALNSSANNNVYGAPRFSTSDTSEQYKEKIQLGQGMGLNPTPSPKIALPPTAVVNALQRDAPAPVEEKKEGKKAKKPLISVDPKTGRKVYNGPPLRNRKVINGITHDHTVPQGNEDDDE